MEPSTHTTAPLTTTPLPSSAPLAGLSDAELLTATRRLVGRSNQLLASLLAHLAEVEARGIHRGRACASLYTYCIYELRFSQDEAFRRVSGARLVRRFPALLDAIATGELHLTGLLMLGPHLTPDNLVEVLALAKHRTKKELARLVPHPRTRARRATPRLDGLDAERPFRERRLERGASGRQQRAGAVERGRGAGRSRAGRVGTSTIQGAVRGERGVRRARREGQGPPLSQKPAPRPRRLAPARDARPRGRARARKVRGDQAATRRRSRDRGRTAQQS